MTTIHDPNPRNNANIRVTFDWTPKSSAFSLIQSGNTYPWGVNLPTAGAPDQPDVNYTATNQELTFTATVIGLTVNDAIRRYLWDFGDGTEGTGPVVTHTYKISVPGTRVHLVAVDNRGFRHIAGQQINLVPAVPISLSQILSINQ